MRLWIDDCRPAPEGYIWLKSTNEALCFITNHIHDIEEIALDHDAGDYVSKGGDYINVLKEIERLARKSPATFIGYKFSIHTANPVGAANMRAIIERNSWEEIK